MKTILLFVFVLSFNFAFAQSVSDYKYISVPKEFADAKMNRFNLNHFLANELQKKKYIIVNESSIDIPTDICNVLMAELDDTSSMLRNRIDLVLKDCNGKTVFTSRGSTMIKEYEEGFKDAIKSAMIQVPVSNPTTNIATNAKVEKEEKKITEDLSLKTPEKIIVSTTTETTKTAANQNEIVVENFLNGNQNLQKIVIGNGQFILVAPNSSVPVATFSKTTKADVFRVVLQNGSMTMGYLENGNLIIEIPNNDGSFRKEIFVKK